MRRRDRRLRYALSPGTRYLGTKYEFPRLLPRSPAPTGKQSQFLGPLGKSRPREVTPRAGKSTARTGGEGWPDPSGEYRIRRRFGKL
jgi:hypothetical protein